MENYKLKQRLGKGAQGSVYLVESKLDGKTYVLKKVECTDESEANKAFKEAMALHELKHNYVCGYKEFFVTWDKEESAMFVCIVMDYYECGDLDKLLRQKRKSQTALEETVIKKWFGEMVEALTFVHSKGVIHRDLKPSNIFMTNKLDISLGDFGVATLMGDARTCTRTTVGTMNWMAPEVLERPYDERSDVWSAGCILLEMCTCGFYDVAQMSGTLADIKHNPEVLEDTLSLMKKYSADLKSVIRQMLRRNFQQRPTARDLKELPYVQACLALSGSNPTERRKKAEVHASKCPLSKDKGLKPALEHLKKCLSNHVCTAEALSYLATLTKQEGIELTLDEKKLVSKAMEKNKEDVGVQKAACQVFSNLVVTANDDDVMYTPDVISNVILAMQSHAGSQPLQLAACSLLIALSAVDHAAKVIGQAGGVQTILAAMKSYPDSAEIQVVCCNAIWSLAVNEGNSGILSEEKGIIDVSKALRNYPKNVDVVEAAAAALISLSMDDDNLDLIEGLNCVGLLVNALQTHPKKSKVVKNALMALTSLVEPDEQSAYQVMSNDMDGQTVNGLPIILSLYKDHRDNADVVENFCTLAREMVEYEEIKDEMKLLKFEEPLKEISKRFKENEEIMGPCMIAVSMLVGDKNVKRPPTARKGVKK